MSDVPDAAHYAGDYLGEDAIRLTSYRLQVVAALERRVSSVLVIGKGDGLVANILTLAGINTTTLDILASLQPDICASVLQMPVADRSHDVALCCQVLEHLPFSCFPAALAELRRVSRKRVVVSLPDQRRFFGVRMAYRLRSWSTGFSLPLLRNRAMPPHRKAVAGHHWEIGYRGTSFGAVKSAFSASGLRITRCMRNPDFPWHTFFISDLTNVHR